MNKEDKDGTGRLSIEFEVDEPQTRYSNTLIPFLLGGFCGLVLMGGMYLLMKYALNEM